MEEKEAATLGQSSHGNQDTPKMKSLEDLATEMAAKMATTEWPDGDDESAEPDAIPAGTFHGSRHRLLAWRL
jgi:hypothetical protein